MHDKYLPFFLLFYSPDQQLARPMSEAVADPPRQAPPPGLGVAVELSDKERQPQELPEQSQPEPAAPVPEECGGFTPMILLELKCKF